MTLHADEFAIDDELVAGLLIDQAPQWADLPLRRLSTSGTVNVTYRLGDDMVVRLPRSPEFGDGPQREARWIPVIAPHVPLAVPTHLMLGRPTGAYPSHWSVLRWIEGTTATPSTLGDLGSAAEALAGFIDSLRRAPTDEVPTGGNYRGFGLVRVDRDVRRWTDRLPADLDRRAILDEWESCLAVGEWDGPPTWLHSDLRGDNLIARSGDLVGVIDWEGCTVGDPSADYLAAWWLFDGDTREVFRDESGAHPADWRRAKGWALHMAVAAIPYYETSNPDFAGQARTALGEILADR